jgi:site-specific recombinase XerD
MKMLPTPKTVSELLTSYEAALTDLGLSYIRRLNVLMRAGTIERRHRLRGEEYLNLEIVAEYLREADERYYTGVCGRKRHQELHREVERFLFFAETGRTNLPNPLLGCRQELGTYYGTIAEDFIETIPNANSRNDARWVAHKYFAWLGEKEIVDLSGADAPQIQNFMQCCSKLLSMNSMRNVRLYLSKLYAYLYGSGLSESDYKSLLSFKMSHETKIYPALPKSDIAKLLDAIDRTTVAGKRSYAAMMLGTVLGLRAVDVVNMKLTDIDWINGEIKILQSKTAKSVILPLTTDVGKALSDYILNARPVTDSKKVFISLKPPYKELATAVTIGEIFRDCCKAAGLPVSKRFHSLRRSLATSMVNAGVSVYDVAQTLGDKNIDSTKPYIAVDLPHLKLCALPFDGIAPNGGDA